MTTTHATLPLDGGALAPDPKFAQFLEWQLATALRRGERFAPRSHASRGVVTTFALLAALAFGACGAFAVQEVGRHAAAKELGEQYAARFELARLREEAARAEVTRLQKLVEKQVISPTEFYEKEVRRVALAQEASVLGLDAIEVGYTGREPDRRLCAPRVADRDLIRERLDQEIGALEFRVSGSEQRAKMIDSLVARGFESAAVAADARRFATRTRRELDLVLRRIELRGRFVRGELDAVAVELLSLEAEALMHVANASEELAAEERPAVERPSASDEKLTDQIIDQIGYAHLEESYSLATRRAELHLAELELATIRARIVAAGCAESPFPSASSRRRSSGR